MAACQGASREHHPCPCDGRSRARRRAQSAAPCWPNSLAQFLDLLVTYHPYGLPGEVRGKSSNEAWAAKETVAELSKAVASNIDDLTVTSCDADTIFPPQYFDA